MKDLIIKALNEVFESVTKSTPKVKTNEEFFDADECSITDLQQIIKNNNLEKINKNTTNTFFMISKNN